MVFQMIGNCVYVIEKNKLNLYEKGVLKQILIFDVNKDFYQFFFVNNLFSRIMMCFRLFINKLDNIIFDNYEIN